MSILFQNIPQLQNRYPDNQWEEILGGCDFSIFLGCNDMTTATYYSDRIGEITVSVASTRKELFYDSCHRLCAGIFGITFDWKTAAPFAR